MFRSRRTSRLLVLLSLLWAVEASAGSRVSLLSFEGDRARPIRWRIAQILRRAGHTVLGFAPRSARSSTASLRDYADYRNVDLFVSGASVEGPEGWQLELRFRGPDGKSVAQPLRFEADNLRRLVQELKGDGQALVDRVVRGNSTGSVADLPTGRALPLPKRRARRARKVDDRPVLPGAAAGESAPSPAPKRASREIDLDEAVGGAAAEQTWDADSDEPSAPRRERRAKAQSRNAFLAAASASSQRAAGKRKRSAQRLAGAGAGQADDAAPLELDEDTRGALEESPGRGAAAADALAEPAPLAAEDAADTAAGEDEPEAISMDDEPAAEEEAEAKPKREKRGLFAGALSRRNRSGEDGSDAAGLSSGSDSVPEDSDPYGAGSEASGSLPSARISARAGIMRRALTYTDDLYNRLRTPTTNGWVYRVDAALFPFKRPLKDRLALIGSYEGALAGTVRDPRTDRAFGVNFSEFEGGLRYRQPIGQHELGVQLTAGAMSAGLDGAAALSGVPEISYTLLSPSVDAGLHLGPVLLRASAGYQHTLGSLGELASAQWFPRVEGAGFEGQLGLELRLSRNVLLHASGALRRFVLNMNSSPDDAREGEAEVAGGAVDVYTSGYFGLAFTL